MSPRRTWDVDELRKAVAENTNLHDTVLALGLRVAGGNYASVRRWIVLLELSTAHWTRRKTPPRPKRPLDEVLVEHSTYNRGPLKRRLYAEGLKQRKCELCGQGEEWRGRRMSLILDHINGVHDDNRLENLQIVCPNCAATLETHCGGNMRRIHHERTCDTCEREFLPKSSDGEARFCSRECYGRSLRGVPVPSRRKVERPPLEVLLAETKENGFSATGRKYGVSDNAIRKWILQAERERRA